MSARKILLTKLWYSACAVFAAGIGIQYDDFGKTLTLMGVAGIAHCILELMILADDKS